MKLKDGAPFLRSTREDPFPFGGYDFREENETGESEEACPNCLPQFFSATEQRIELK